MNVKGSRDRGRPKKRWLDVIKSDMRTVGLCVYVDDVKDRVKWRLRHGWLILNSWDISEREEEVDRLQKHDEFL